MHPVILEALVAAHQQDVERSVRDSRVSRGFRRGTAARRRHSFSAAHRRSQQD